MLSEEEAKTKWCPYASVTGKDANGCGTYWNGEPAYMCIASACMAWRWRRRYADDAKEAKISHVTGYCGLAGKP